MNAHRIIEAALSVARKAGARKAESRLESIQFAPHYAEPGYSSSHPVILFSNWNKFDRYDPPSGKRLPVEPDAGIWQRAVKLLEQVAELEWEDEWTTCSDCSGAIRTQADSYGWIRSYVELDCELICQDCTKQHADEVLETFVCESGKAIPRNLGISPSDHGFARLDNVFEHGFHPGQDADPRKIAAALEARGVTRWLFTLDSVGQFDARFSVWADAEEFAALPPASRELSDAESDGPSVSEAMKRGLQEASLKMSRLPAGPGIQYASIKPDGSADVRIVSPEEFVQGIKP